MCFKVKLLAVFFHYNEPPDRAPELCSGLQTTYSKLTLSSVFHLWSVCVHMGSSLWNRETKDKVVSLIANNSKRCSSPATIETCYGTASLSGH